LKKIECLLITIVKNKKNSFSKTLLLKNRLNIFLVSTKL